MRVLVCAATSFEAEACRRGIAAARKSDRIFVLQTGVGLQAARRSLSRWLETNERPDLIVATGFAGTIEENLRPGAWVCVTEIYQWQQDEKPQFIACSTEVDGVDHSVPCRIVSAQELVDYGTSASLLQQDLGPGLSVVVDMESAALAAIANGINVRFFGIRMVTDSPHQALPRFVYDFTKAFSGLERTRERVQYFTKGLFELVSKPSSAVRLVQNGRRWGISLEEKWEELAPQLISRMGSA